jgi:hypothetical protein
MPDTGYTSGDATLWLALAALLAAIVVAFFWYKGRPIPGAHVFRASRFSRGNLLVPTQVAISPTSVIHYTPEWVGGREQSMHLAHVASVLIDRNLFFADVMIESSGGASPVRCHGHRKKHALQIKRLIEQFQSQHYRGRQVADGGPHL